ncbi:MAG: hypothetical protein IPP39_05315 [Chitinophagaceae bacterium]|nr:hypothetical protein [Chitinophagaceae bacterium]
MELASINIHINLAIAEKNTDRKTLWEGWKDSASKDSLKIEVFKQLAHVYIHKKDGVKRLAIFSLFRIMRTRT